MREGAEKHVDAFATVEMRDAEDTRRPRLDWSGSQCALPHAEVDQLRDDADLLAIDAVEFRDSLGRVAAGGDDALGAADMHPFQPRLH